MITGDVNNSFLSTGCLSISSSLAYLGFVNDESDVVAFDLQDDNGNAAAAIPPATAVEINLRLFVFILISDL